MRGVHLRFKFFSDFKHFFSFSIQMFVFAFKHTSNSMKFNESQRPFCEAPFGLFPPTGNRPHKRTDAPVQILDEEKLNSMHNLDEVFRNSREEIFETIGRLWPSSCEERVSDEAGRESVQKCAGLRRQIERCYCLRL